ncbi:MAG: hypothetical protein IT259_12005 [Saprospiraceae bacterium]|nr:hypothetical protein [Saprospiraceae bacterium]
MSDFDTLTPAEKAQLSEAPVLIVALLAAADGEFDRHEQDWTDRLVDVFTYAKPKLINDFYAPVSTGFVKKVSTKLASLPAETDARETALAAELEAINPLLAKLAPALGAALYKSFRTLALETAKASGGFLRIGAVSSVESRWVDLPMLTPILPPGH